MRKVFMGELSRLFGVGATVKIGEKEWKVSPWTYKIQAEFEEYLEGQAWKTAERARGKVPESSLSDIRAQTARQITTGEYSPGSQGFIDAIMTTKHGRRFLYLLIEAIDPAITGTDIDDFFAQYPKEAFTAIMEAGSDPFRKILPPTVAADAS